MCDWALGLEKNVFADLYTWFINSTLFCSLKLAGSSHILTKFVDAHRRTAQIFVT